MRDWLLNHGYVQYEDSRYYINYDEGIRVRLDSDQQVHYDSIHGQTKALIDLIEEMVKYIPFPL